MTMLGAKLAADEALNCALEAEAFRQTSAIALRNGHPFASAICEDLANVYEKLAKRAAQQVCA